MDKFSYIIEKMFEGRIEERDKIFFINELQSYELLKDLFPFLVHQKLVCQFHEMIVKYGLISFMNKETWRALNKLVIYENVKYEEYIYEMKKICNEFHNRNIEYVFIKGIHLVNFLYANPEGRIQRSFNDIDVLVKKYDIGRVNNVLMDLGYFNGEYCPESHSLRRFRREEEIAFLMNSHQAPQYVKPSRNSKISASDTLNIDINFTVFWGGKMQDQIATEELLKARIVRKDAEGNNYYSLKPEHDLLQLIYHIYKDTVYESKKMDNEELLLCNLIDVYRFIEIMGDKIDWESFINIITQVNIMKEVSYVLKKIKHWISNKYIDDLLLKLCSCLK